MNRFSRAFHYCPSVVYDQGEKVRGISAPRSLSQDRNRRFTFATPNIRAMKALFPAVTFIFPPKTSLQATFCTPMLPAVPKACETIKKTHNFLPQLKQITREVNESLRLLNLAQNVIVIAGRKVIILAINYSFIFREKNM